MSVAADTTNNEDVLAQKKGNHKGCPYDGLAGSYFLRNDGRISGFSPSRE